MRDLPPPPPPPPGTPRLLLGAAAALLLAGGCFSSNTRHTLHYYFTGVSLPGQGLPQFTIVGYVDDQPFVWYDSHTRRDLPRSPWIRKVEQEDPQYWDWQTQLSRSWELYFRVTLWGRFNHSQGEYERRREGGGCEAGCVSRSLRKWLADYKPQNPQRAMVSKGLGKNLRRALLDQAKGPSSPASCISQRPQQRPPGAHETRH